MQIAFLFKGSGVQKENTFLRCAGKHQPSHFRKNHAAATKKYERCDMKTKLKEDGHITFKNNFLNGSFVTLSY
jgi:hypothetical protein